MKVIEVVAAIIKKEDKIFITRRSYGEFKDMWEFPGGKIEAGEKKETALIREIKEELELDIKRE
jgi:8-oxo-dGTP diphosphatase